MTHCTYFSYLSNKHNTHLATFQETHTFTSPNENFASSVTSYQLHIVSSVHPFDSRPSLASPQTVERHCHPP